eukprot:87574-Lingulodinium_polyedra.AAC.1
MVWPGLLALPVFPTHPNQYVFGLVGTGGVFSSSNTIGNRIRWHWWAVQLIQACRVVGSVGTGE